ncbi:hypothetical protein B1756_03500 [Natrarchaeobaculum aegyptiacum]|uniref:ABC transporter substrate-binding protein n=2 Tax=Natrarchaeobaculum aegyptiacum TaxID=745377 RepID=A0A2Z2HZ47_9EURY|nr:hypothetical protein B1756_03500 [Natrarchaeobaculum aegyptiacum]
MGGSGGNTLTYLNRGGAIQDAEMEVLAEWEEENDVEIQFQSAAEDSEMMESIAADPSGYDIVTLSPYGYGLDAVHPQYSDEEYFADIDYDQVPNYEENIQEEWREIDFLQGHDKGLFYHVSAQGLAYNTEHVDGIESWEDIKDPDLEGQVTLFGSAPTRFGQCCAALGYDVAEALEDDDLFDEVFEEIEAQHQNVYQYWATGDQFMGDLSEEQAHVASAWGGRVESLYHDGVPVDYTIPEEGCVQWSVAFSILEESDMKAEAYDLLNWIYQEDVALEMVDQHYYPIPLTGDHEELEGRFESLDADAVVSFDWEAVIANIEDIEQRFDQILAS